MWEADSRSDSVKIVHLETFAYIGPPYCSLHVSRSATGLALRLTWPRSKQSDAMQLDGADGLVSTGSDWSELGGFAQDPKYL